MGWLKGDIEKDEPIRRPQTRDAKLAVIRDTFESQPLGGWNGKEQNVYLKEIGLEIGGGRNKARTEEELDLILTDLEAAKMILFE